MNIDAVATPAYRTLLQKRYEQPGWGASGYSHADEVRRWAQKIEARSAIDYGCGRGTLAPVVPELSWQEYDPGMRGFDVLPEPADLVVCTDVLEHVEPGCLTSVLTHLRLLARRGMYINIGLGRAKEVLPDGRNAHLIQEGEAWWRQTLTENRIFPELIQRFKGRRVWVRSGR
jgi:hypothetical protein